MSETNLKSRPRLAWTALLLLTAWVSATAVRIEVLNHQMGGFLPRPQPPSIEGNDIPWRSSSRRMMEPAYRRSILYNRGMEAADLDDDAVMTVGLSPSEQEELERYLQRVEYNSELRAIVSGPGILQYLLVPLTVGLAVTFWPSQSTRYRVVLSVCIVLCLTAGVLAFYRQYFQAVID